MSFFEAETRHGACTGPTLYRPYRAQGGTSCCATWQRSLARVGPKEGRGGGGCPRLNAVDRVTERSAEVTPASVSAAPSLQALSDAAPLASPRLEDTKATRDRRPPCELRVANVQPHGSGEGGSRKEHVCIYSEDTAGDWFTYNNHFSHNNV